MKAQLHQYMDQQLAERDARLNKAQEAKDTTTMWRLISASMEEAFIQFLGLNHKDAKLMRGRGTVTIEKQSLQPHSAAPTNNHNDVEKLKRRAAHHTTQANRLNHVAKRMKAIAKHNLTDHQKSANYQHNSNAMETYKQVATTMGFAKPLDLSKETPADDQQSRCHIPSQPDRVSKPVEKLRIRHAILQRQLEHTPRNLHATSIR